MVTPSPNKKRRFVLRVCFPPGLFRCVAVWSSRPPRRLVPVRLGRARCVSRSRLTFRALPGRLVASCRFPPPLRARFPAPPPPRPCASVRFLPPSEPLPFASCRLPRRFPAAFRAASVRFLLLPAFHVFAFSRSPFWAASLFQKSSPFSAFSTFFEKGRFFSVFSKCFGFFDKNAHFWPILGVFRAMGRTLAGGKVRKGGWLHHPQIKYRNCYFFSVS